MIRSGISLQFQSLYHHFATLKESQKSSFRLSNIAPALTLFSKIILPIFYHSTSVGATPQDLPHDMEDMGGHGLPHNFEYPGWARGTMKYLQPLEWPQVADEPIPSKWLQVAALENSKRVAASGRSRQFRAGGRKWP